MVSSSSTPVERARALSALIRVSAPEAERSRRLTDEVAQSLLNAGLFSALPPAAEGGLGASRVDFFEMVEEIASADGSAGWTLSLCSASAFFVHKGASRKAREEVFGSGPVAIWTSLLPRARSTKIEGGFLVSGSFGWGSGSSFARWVLVAEEAPDRDGQQWFRAYLLPKEDVDIKPGSWDAMGLMATSSDDYGIADKFVPDHRTFEFPFLQSSEAGSISTQFLVYLNQVGLAAAVSGIAARALAEFLAAAAKINRTAAQSAQAEDGVVQYGLGEVEGRLRAARSYYLTLIAEQDRYIAAHGAPHPKLTFDGMQAAHTLARAARDMTMFAFDQAGAGVVYTSDPLQRCVRDIFTALKHVTFTPTFLTRVGKARLGLAVPVTRLKSAS